MNHIKDFFKIKIVYLYVNILLNNKNIALSNYIIFGQASEIPPSLQK